MPLHPPRLIMGIQTKNMLPLLPKPIVLDISGDGEANCAGLDAISDILDNMVTNHGVQVNTLFIDNNLPNSVTELKGFEYYKSLLRNSGFIMEAKSFMDAGKLVPDAVVIGMVGAAKVNPVAFVLYVVVHVDQRAAHLFERAGIDGAGQISPPQPLKQVHCRLPC